MLVVRQRSFGKVVSFIFILLKKKQGRTIKISMDRRRPRKPKSSSPHPSSTSSSTWNRAVPAPRKSSWRNGSGEKPGHLKKPHKDNIRHQLEHCPGERKFCEWLKNFIRSKHLNFITTIIWVIHRCSDMDDLKLCEQIMRLIRSEDTCQRAVNTPEGSHEYTPLCRAAYRGSLRMLKLLVSKGADVTYTNSHGENLLSTMTIGRKDSLLQHGGNEMFINDRFDQCLQYIENRQRYVKLTTEREAEKVKKAATFVPFRPRRVMKAIVKVQRWWRKKRSRE